jgi:Flp pilus assembly protein TadD
MKIITILMVLAWACIHGLPHAIAADASTKSMRQAKGASDKTCAELSQEEATRLGLIRQMLTEGKPHAAIAHLDAAHIQNEHAELLRADGLRQTGRAAQSQTIYEQLKNSCVSGYAYRGMGLIASETGDTQQALRHLKAASDALPTEHTIRNDYGYVLMQSGEHASALHEFLTSVELAPDYRQAAHNLILLLYQQGDITKAEAFAKQFGVVTEEMQQLRTLAHKNNVAMP